MTRREPGCQRSGLAAVLFAVMLATGSAAAADWAERPYNPPVGSRWIIQRDLFSEQNDAGAISKKTFKITSDLKIVGKDAAGFTAIYARRASSYDNDDKDAEAMERPALAALQGIEYHIAMDPAGKPLRVDNLADVEAALRNMVDKITATDKDPKTAAVLRQILSPMLDVDEKRAAELYMDQLPNLALAQNTGLKPGDTRRESVEQPNPMGKLVINRSMTIKEADAASGDATYVLTESYDPSAMRAFQLQVLENMRKQGIDVGEPEKTINEMELSLDNQTEFKVVDGMTRNTIEDSTMIANLTGTRRVIKSRKVVTVTPAP